MTKQLNYLLICFFAAISFSSTYAAEEAVTAENSSTTETEELVLNQAEELVENELEVERNEGDDDFVPSAQISEDLSVSFPVDI